MESLRHANARIKWKSGKTKENMKFQKNPSIVERKEIKSEERR